LFSMPYPPFGFAALFARPIPQEAKSGRAGLKRRPAHHSR
jgi:hypothetical protein